MENLLRKKIWIRQNECLVILHVCCRQVRLNPTAVNNEVEMLKQFCGEGEERLLKSVRYTSGLNYIYLHTLFGGNTLCLFTFLIFFFTTCFAIFFRLWIFKWMPCPSMETGARWDVLSSDWALWRWYFIHHLQHCWAFPQQGKSIWYLLVLRQSQRSSYLPIKKQNSQSKQNKKPCISYAPSYNKICGAINTMWTPATAQLPFLLQNVSSGFWKIRETSAGFVYLQMFRSEIWACDFFDTDLF